MKMTAELVQSWNMLLLNSLAKLSELLNRNDCGYNKMIKRTIWPRNLNDFAASFKDLFF